ncbi:MAG: hydroxymethylglutaryl-CoA reductase [Nitrospirae bacterium]|nr:hydroxymethylglutaryl-CoA reductase [Nitrospirota bacterium]
MIPQFILRKLYKKGSLKNADNGIEFILENSLASATITRIKGIQVDNNGIPLPQIDIKGESGFVKAESINENTPVQFEKGREIDVRLSTDRLTDGEHLIKISVASKEFGELNFDIRDKV